MLYEAIDVLKLLLIFNNIARLLPFTLVPVKLAVPIELSHVHLITNRFSSTNVMDIRLYAQMFDFRLDQ